MSETHKWADGPWFVRERPADDGLAIIEDGRQNGLWPIVCEWNEADLVAAAPALYEAGKAALDLLKYLDEELGGALPCDDSEFDPVVDKLSAALKAARGEPS